MAGERTEITEVVVPDSAVAGSTVNVTMTIMNIGTDSVHVAAIAVRDTVDRFISWLEADIPAGESESFSGSFIMPGEEATIHAYSYYMGDDGYWHYDDEVAATVKLAAGAPDILSIIGPLLVLGLMAAMIMPMTKGLGEGGLK